MMRELGSLLREMQMVKTCVECGLLCCLGVLGVLGVLGIVLAGDEMLTGDDTSREIE